MTDILFKTEDYIFSYRVAGILIQDDKVLLQKPTDDTGFAFPGGHAELGETNAQTLQREFMEEICTPIEVGELKWVGENFFPWQNKPCHQICLYYQVSLNGDAQIPKEGWFPANDRIEGRNIEIEFHWIPLEQIEEKLIYPPQAIEFLKHPNDGFQHFIYHQDL